MANSPPRSALRHDERKDDVGNESEASEDDAENERDADDGDIHIQVFGKAGTHTEDLTFFAEELFLGHDNLYFSENLTRRQSRWLMERLTKKLVQNGRSSSPMSSMLGAGAAARGCAAIGSSGAGMLGAVAAPMFSILHACRLTKYLP